VRDKELAKACEPVRERELLRREGDLLSDLLAGELDQRSGQRDHKDGDEVGEDQPEVHEAGESESGDPPAEVSVLLERLRDVDFVLSELSNAGGIWRAGSECRRPFSTSTTGALAGAFAAALASGLATEIDRDASESWRVPSRRSRSLLIRLRCTRGSLQAQRLLFQRPALSFKVLS